MALYPAVGLNSLPLQTFKFCFTFYFNHYFNNCLLYFYPYPYPYPYLYPYPYISFAVLCFAMLFDILGMGNPPSTPPLSRESCVAVMVARLSLAKILVE
jgi:hypothetical protein